MCRKNVLNTSRGHVVYLKHTEYKCSSIMYYRMSGVVGKWMVPVSKSTCVGP